jgi:hypothetical protein
MLPDNGARGDGAGRSLPPAGGEFGFGGGETSMVRFIPGFDKGKDAFRPPEQVSKHRALLTVAVAAAGESIHTAGLLCRASGNKRSVRNGGSTLPGKKTMRVS